MLLVAEMAKLQAIIVDKRLVSIQAIADGTINIATTKMFPTARKETTHVMATIAASK
jgi:hypothetical protein